VAGLLDVATALKVLPKVALAVWLGGVPVPLVNVMVGVTAATVIVRFELPVLKLPFAAAVALTVQVPTPVKLTVVPEKLQPVDPAVTTEYAIDPVLFVVATALKVLPKVALAV
jgi:hypothetical protein